MREIKFRGKDSKTGEWRHGSLVYYPDNGLGDEAAYIFDPHETDAGNAEVIIEEDSETTEHFSPIIWNVIPSTIGQYTGLKDKNGNEIYEGDIVQFMDGYRIIDDWDEYINRGTIFYDTEYACFGTTNLNQIDMKDLIDNADYEVIGNIHDNPELLEGGKAK
jgi:uncharacterized phage protein (TIGR01671 family)